MLFSRFLAAAAAALFSIASLGPVSVAAGVRSNVSSGIPRHVLTLAYYGAGHQAEDVPASWMAAHVDFTEQSEYYPNLSRAFHKAGGRYTVLYVDPIFQYHCDGSPPSGKCSDQLSSAGPESAWYHSEGSIAAASRIYKRAGDFGYANAINQGSPAAQAHFKTVTRRYVDEGGYDFLFCDDTVDSLSPQRTSPFYNWNAQPFEEGGSNESLRLHVDQMINSGAAPCITNNGTTAYVGTKYPDANVAGTAREECFADFSPYAIDGKDTLTAPGNNTWTQVENDILSVLLLHHQKYYFCFGEYYGGASHPDVRLYYLASWWLSYDPSWSVAVPKITSPPDPHGYEVEVYPEYGIVPRNPVQSATTPDVNQLRTPTGAYVREFATCYQDGAPIGGCAAVVNPSATATVSMPPMTRAYKSSLVVNGASWYMGGTATWTGSVPASLSPAQGIILKQQ